MKATDLQNRLAHLAPGETLLLSAAEVEEAFHYCPTLEERRAAVANLAVWYRCWLTFCGTGESQILFTRHDDLAAEISDSPFMELDGTRS